MPIELKVFLDYKKAIKITEIEEPCDSFIFKPLAFFILRKTNEYPLKPSHFSMISITLVIASSFFLSKGSLLGFFLGGIGVFIFNISNSCVDLLEEIKEIKNKYKELYDYFFDLLAIIFFFVGLYVGLSKSNQGLQNFTWVAVFFLLLHKGVYRFYKEQYAFYLDDNPRGRQKKLERYRRDLIKLNRSHGHYFVKFLLVVVLSLNKFLKTPESLSGYQTEKYLNLNKSILPLWGAISGTSHLLILTISLIFYIPSLYFFFAIILANIWATFVIMIQFGVNELLEKER
jgi:hypothetical protein